MRRPVAFDPNNKNRGKGRRRGKISVDVDSVNLTGSLTFYAPPDPPTNGYIIVSDSNTVKGIAVGSAKPVFWTADDSNIVSIVNGLPGNTTNVTTVAGAFSYLASSGEYYIMESRNEDIVTDKLVLEVDFSKKSSYPTSGTTVYDLSGNNFTGTLQNGVGFNSSDEVATFDGSNDQIEITNSSNFGNFTWSNGLSLVVIYKVDPANFTSNGQYRALLGVGSGTRSFNYYLRRNSAGNLQFHFSALGYGSLSNTYAADSSKYYVATFVQQSNGTGTYYLDNTSIGSHSQNNVIPSYSSTYSQYIGRADNLTAGNIAKVLIYNKPLSESERNKIYYGGDIPTTGLKIALNNNLIHSFYNNEWRQNLTGLYSNTNLPSSFISHNNLNGDFDGLTEFTYCLWIKHYTTPSGYSFSPFNKYAGTTTAVVRLYHFGDTSGIDDRFTFYMNAGNGWTGYGAYYANQGETFFLAMQYNSTTGGKVWVNGVPGSRGGRTGTIATNSANFYIYPDNSSTTNSKVKEAYVYTTELSDEEVLKVFNETRGKYGV